MIHAFKLLCRRCFVGVLLAAATLDGFAAPQAVDAADETRELASRLEAQVAEIAGSQSLSHKEKARRISTAARNAVNEATTYNRNSAYILAAAQQLAQAAASAAPQFAEVIGGAVASSPQVALVEGAPASVRMTALAAAESQTQGMAARPGSTASDPVTATPRVESGTSFAPTSSAMKVNERRGVATAVSKVEFAGANSPVLLSDGSPSKDKATRITVSATASARHDDNIFLTPDDEADATILTLSPGVSFEYGFRSLGRFSATYQQAFVRYTGESIPDASLGSGAANFVYEDGKLSVNGAASFRQINQNTSATAGLGSQLFRRDLLDILFGAESPLTAKTRVRAGANFNREKYKTAGLVGTRRFEIPVKLFYETTPKTRMGLGATYRKVDPQGGGPSGTDWYYNIAASGDFTPKLSGDLSVGYRTREVSANPRENLWGFDGALRYTPTLKTGVALQFSRDFSTGALGESLASDRYALTFSADPTLQWSFGASLAYAKSDYGPAVFTNAPVVFARNDEFFEGSLFASYLVNRWLSASIDYIFRTNDSTTPNANYRNNQLNLTLGVRY
ncbi:MAG TPA: outer membrane beta-barrel protein [Opitutaceae bacterium]|nr:outer membrane beta-barrel protein [Opitutaceae bacterium]